VAVLSLVGLSTALYLTLFQLKIVSSVWDPFALGGSRWVLRRSPLVRWLGFPDASFGIGLYAAELVLELPGGSDRAVARPGQLLALGAVASAMAGGSVLLVGLQAVYGHWCSLCLVSAAASIAIAVLVAPEVAAAVRAVSRRRGNGASLADAVDPDHLYPGQHHPGQRHPGQRDRATPSAVIDKNRSPR